MNATTLPVEARALIDRLSLRPHPEGGWFRETYRSPRIISPSVLRDEAAETTGPASDAARWLQSAGTDASERSLVTSILFLLAGGGRSRLHRLRSEELWLHHAGDSLILRSGASCDEAGRIIEPRVDVLGQGSQAALQAVVPCGWWQEAELEPGPHGFSLLACVVVPGFQFGDFEMHPAGTDG
jgi:predicted cupin superfamily sugar epimerase